MVAAVAIVMTVGMCVQTQREETNQMQSILGRYASD